MANGVADYGEIRRYVLKVSFTARRWHGMATRGGRKQPAALLSITFQKQKDPRHPVPRVTEGVAVRIFTTRDAV